MGQVKMRKAAQTLHFNEGKPQGYHLTQLVYAPIKEKDLIKYMANSANVPESTIESAVAAIADGILYYAINGHRVSFPGFGGFWCSLKAKTAKRLSELKQVDVVFRSETKGMERELKGMERTILISNDIRPFNFQAVETAITSLQIPLTPEKIINSQLSILNYQFSIINSQLVKNEENIWNCQGCDVLPEAPVHPQVRGK